MSELVVFLANLSAIAFLILGIATVLEWVKRRDSTLRWLALAIVLLSAVVLAGNVAKLVTPATPLLNQVSLLCFTGSGYALIRYRAAAIPLPRRWHVTAITTMVAASGLYIGAHWLTSSKAWLAATGVALVLIWCVAVGESIIRFWLAANRLHAVQAWRLRSLSLGFGGLVVVLLIAVSAGTLFANVVVQVLVELVVLAIVPLLFVSFAPPAWLRREWRSREEEGLREFMEVLLVSEDPRELRASRALGWAMRLVGGAAAVVFDDSSSPTAVSHLVPDEVAELDGQIAKLHKGVNRIKLSGSERSVLVLPISGLSRHATLAVLSGPFTPAFGSDEINRVQQFMSAYVTAVDRRRLIAQLEESNTSLQAATRHKSAFLANMSHELRTPLNSIIGFSELLVDGSPGQFDQATHNRFLQQILTSGRHLLALINDILDLSKVEAGQMELRLQTVSVTEVVDQVVKTLEPLAANKSIEIKVDVATAGDITADAGKLKQMLLNLGSNAIKFTPDGGRVTIAARRSLNSVEFSVTDTGIGIAEADLPLIFKEFHQLDAGPGRRQDGTGLGLALTKRFALLHGGDVHVQSDIEHGSTFTLILPISPAANALKKPELAASLNGHGSGPLILIVEDDMAAAELLNRQLAGAGYRTEVARTGAEALIKARELRPVAITLDIILPDLDGWEVISRIKGDPATSSVPIIVVSVVDNPEIGVALGAIDYFVKPVDGEELVSRLKEISGRRSSQAPDLVGVLRQVVPDHTRPR